MISKYRFFFKKQQMAHHIYKIDPLTQRSKKVYISQPRHVLRPVFLIPFEDLIKIEPGLRDCKCCSSAKFHKMHDFLTYSFKNQRAKKGVNHWSNNGLTLYYSFVKNVHDNINFDTTFLMSSKREFISQYT